MVALQCLAVSTRVIRMRHRYRAPYPTIIAAIGIAFTTPVGDARAQDTAPACEVRGSHAWLASRPSPLDSAAMRLSGGWAKICYSRPSARGRPVYGGLVRMGTVWRTGANEPTTVHLTTAARIAGVSLAPKRYLLMTVPRQDRWEILFYTTDATEPAAMYQTMVLVGHGYAIPEPLLESVETFTIRVEDDTSSKAFVLEWGRQRVRLDMKADEAIGSPVRGPK
jgi:Protein of unknown function (DUF2911).